MQLERPLVQFQQRFHPQLAGIVGQFLDIRMQTLWEEGTLSNDRITALRINQEEDDEDRRDGIADEIELAD